MYAYDLIYVQLQLSLFRNEPVSPYSERELSSGQTLCWIQKNTDFWNQNIPLTNSPRQHLANKTMFLGPFRV